MSCQKIAIPEKVTPRIRYRNPCDIIDSLGHISWKSRSAVQIRRKSHHTVSVILTWWRNQMETFSALLAISAGTSPVNSPHKRPVARSFDVLFDLRLNKRLSKQLWGWWLETLSSPLPFIEPITFYFHCNIWGCMCSAGPFEYRWLKGYIYSSCYQDVCYIIFCHLLYIHSGKTGNLFSLCSLWWV